MLNPNERIHSWEIVFTTIDDTKNIPSSIQSRKLTATELGLNFSDTITSKIDEVVESMYPVTWNDG